MSQKPTVQKTPLQQDVYLVFNSDFDSGNLDMVQIDAPKQTSSSGGEMTEIAARLYTKPDGPEAAPTKNKTWFHFSVSLLPTGRSAGLTSNNNEIGGEDAVLVQFRLMNLNRVQKLFSQGMRPVYRTSPLALVDKGDDGVDAKWSRIPTSPTTTYVDSHMELLFSFPLAPGIVYYFAYCIPYSYTKLQKKLSMLLPREDDNPINRFKKNSSCSASSKIPVPVSFSASKRIYIHRDILVTSNDQLNVDCLTISSTDFLLPSKEETLDQLHPIKGTNRPRKFDMKKKKFVFISARVHPAETISSFMLDGFLNFITCHTDPKASLLRSKYVFKIIPMLNPDGVVRGNYRGDANGTNLNRVYDNPDFLRYPTIWATKAYIDYLQKLGQLEFYIDLHGHANKAGSFLFGNWLPDISQQYEELLFARYCYLNNPLFDMSECDFAPKEMLPNTQTLSSLPQTTEQTKDGTGRVAIHRLTNLTHCYTFEANYYGSKLDRRTSLLSKTGSSSSITSMSASSSTLHNSTSSIASAPKNPGDHRFKMQDQLMMGQSIGLAIFDYTFSQHPIATMRRQDEKMHKWIMDRLRKLYMKARVPFPTKSAIENLTKQNDNTTLSSKF